VFIAGPVLTLWKEREPVYRRRHASIAAENNGVVPAYATGTASEQVDPNKARRLKRGQRLTSPDDPENVSREEFEDLVRDLHVDPAPRRTAVADRPARKAKAAAPKPAPKPAAPPDDSADALPEDTVMPARPDGDSAPKPKRSSAAAKRRGKHGRPR
jgi:hypothetical protein